MSMTLTFMLFFMTLTIMTLTFRTMIMTLSFTFTFMIMLIFMTKAKEVCKTLQKTRLMRMFDLFSAIFKYSVHLIMFYFILFLFS